MINIEVTVRFRIDNFINCGITSITITAFEELLRCIHEQNFMSFFFT